MMYLLLAYERAHDAMEAAAALGEAGVVGGQLIPRPRTLTAKCGVALRIRADAAQAALAALAPRGLIGEAYASDDGRHWTPCLPDQLPGGTATDG